MPIGKTATLNIKKTRSWTIITTHIDLIEGGEIVPYAIELKIRISRERKR